MIAGLLLVEDDAVVLGLEPLHGVLLAQPVLRADPAGLAAPVADIEAGSAHHDVEVHAVDADAGVVLDAQVDVLLDAEAEVAIVGEVLLPQLVLLHLEAPLQDFFGLQVTLVRTEKMSCEVSCWYFISQLAVRV